MKYMIISNCCVCVCLQIITSPSNCALINIHHHLHSFSCSYLHFVISNICHLLSFVYENIVLDSDCLGFIAWFFFLLCKTRDIQAAGKGSAEMYLLGYKYHIQQVKKKNLIIRNKQQIKYTQKHSSTPEIMLLVLSMVHQTSYDV